MPPRTIAISRRNSAYQVLESLLSNRRKRHQRRAFVLEGVQAIETAVAHGWAFDAVMYDPAGRLSVWARDIVARTAADRYEMTGELLAGLSRKDEASEILALVRMPANRLDRIPTPSDLLVAVMDRPVSPGNLGTLIRSCDAFGVHGLIITGHGADMYDPAAIAASRGSLFAVPVVHADSPAEVSAWAADVRRRLGACQLVGTDEHADIDLARHRFVGPTVTLFGNETHGMSQACRDLCDARVRIPMVGSATSLNVSVAASIVFYEIGRQRRADPRAAGAGPEQR